MVCSLRWTNMHSVSKYKALLELYLYFAVPSEWPLFSLCTEVFSEVFCGCGTSFYELRLLLNSSWLKIAQVARDWSAKKRKNIPSHCGQVKKLSPRTRDRKRKWRCLKHFRIQSSVENILLFTFWGELIYHIYLDQNQTPQNPESYACNVSRF